MKYILEHSGIWKTFWNIVIKGTYFDTFWKMEHIPKYSGNWNKNFSI